LSEITCACRMEQVIAGLLSGDNNVRSTAEQTYNKGLAENAVGTLEALLQTLFTSEDSSHRNMCGVLSRRLLRDEEKAVWKNMTSTNRQQTRSALLNAIAIDSDAKVRKKVALLIAEVAKLCQALEQAAPGNGEGWTDLLMKLVELCNRNDDPMTRVAVMESFNYLAEYAPDTVLPHSTDFCKVVAPIMTQDQNLSVRISALEAVTSLLRSMDSLGKDFEELVPGMMSVLISALEKGEEIVVQEGLKTLVEVVEEHPKFLIGYLEGLWQLMNQIASATNLEDDTRMLGIELLLTVSEKNPAAVRKHTQIVEAIVTSAISLIAEGSEIEEEDLDPTQNPDEDLSEMGQEALIRFTKSLGAKAVIPCAFAQVQVFIQDADWRKRRAGLLAIAMVSERGGKFFFEKMTQIVNMVLPFLVKEPHSRVRLTAVHVLGLLCISFRNLDTEERYAIAEAEGGFDDDEDAQATNFQRKFSVPILEGLIHVLGEEKQGWKIREEAASAVLAFCAGCQDAELLAPFEEKLLSSLFGIIQSGPMSTKSEGLTAVASLASVIGASFGKYYDHFMPLAKGLVAAENIESNGEDSVETLRGKAMECVGLMGNAVSKDKFEPDARQMMDLLLKQLQQSGGENQDPTAKEYIVRATARICTAMGEKFLPYLQYIIPDLVESAKREIEITIEDTPFDGMAAPEQNVPGMETLDMHVRGLGGKRIGFNTWAAQEKELACNMLYTYADGFGESFLPYIPQTAAVLLREVMSPMYTVRIAAICALPRLLSSLSAALKKDASLAQAAQELFVNILQQLLQALDMDDEFEEEDLEDEEDEETEEVMLIVAECIAAVLRTAFESGGLTDSNVDVMFSNEYNNGQRTPRFGVPGQEVANVLTEIVKKMQARVEKRMVQHKKLQILGVDVDAQMLENLEEADKRTNEFMDSLCEGIGCIIKAHGGNIIGPCRQICQPFSDSLLTIPGMSAPLNAVGLFFYDDIIEYGGNGAHEFVEKGIQHMLRCADSDNYLLRQAACYGLGVSAEHGGPVVDQFVQPVLSKLLEVIKAPESRKGTNGSATDNAISAVYKLCLHRSAIVPKTVLGELLSLLPIDSDRLEARIVHYRLMRHLAQNDDIAKEYGETMRNVLRKAAASTKGFNQSKQEYDEDDSILTVQTRSFVQSM